MSVGSVPSLRGLQEYRTFYAVHLHVVVFGARHDSDSDVLTWTGGHIRILKRGEGRRCKPRREYNYKASCMLY